MQQNLIKLTVALPIWNSKTIAWLALEGLCKQKVNVPWELLIAEEQINEFGQDAVLKYVRRLRKAGCVSVRYLSLQYKITLPNKWQYLMEHRAESSQAFIFQAADCYSEPNRLQSTYDAMQDGYDWVQNRCGYFYSFHYYNCLKYDQATFGKGCKTGLNTAVSTDILYRMRSSFQESGIDNLLLKVLAPQNPLWREGDILGGINTDGLNNISYARRHYFYKPTPPFNATEIAIHDIVPKLIADRMVKTEGRK